MDLLAITYNNLTNLDTWPASTSQNYKQAAKTSVWICVRKMVLIKKQTKHMKSSNEEAVAVKIGQ